MVKGAVIMCGGGGGGERVEYVYRDVPVKNDPTPTPVSVSDVTQSASAERYATEQERRRRGQKANRLSADRTTILGSVGDMANAIRTTLG